jgi:hypothetical protein
VSIVAAFSQADFPMGFLILFVSVTVMATLGLLGILVGAEQEHRERQGRDRGF